MDFDFEEAKQILTSLAKGLDPETALRLPEHSVYLSPSVMRALFVALVALEDAERSKNRRRGASKAENAGKTWTEEDDQSLINLFDAGTELGDIAKSMGRSLASIQARLFKHGRISEGGFPARGGGGKMFAGPGSDTKHDASPTGEPRGTTPR